MPLYLAVVHYPCSNKQGEVVTTSITNFDIHDIGRSGRTYECEAVYLVNPVPSQLWFANRVLEHWTEGAGAEYNWTRKESMSRVQTIEDLVTLTEQLEAKHGRPPVYIATSARKTHETWGYVAMREKMEADPDTPWVLLFGTGWGLHKDLMDEVDYILDPIYGAGDYNHLSVRAAVAIILDRLRGEKWHESKL
ncbi:RNA methyltransferase [Candidatus Sumerlaeota bacterium]|nr:RNA methyltransferase [Candidatus Sumerlaeota bacterium]